jgi:hypothetical protein
LAEVQDVNLSGDWVANNGKRWTLFNKEDWIYLIREDQWCRFRGKSDGREIKYRTYVKLGGVVPGCENYVDVPLEYDAKLVLSEDGNRLDNVVPERLVKETCVLQLRKTVPEFWITRSERSAH